jgi:GTP-binding protein EngB required for normal cell division
MACSKTEFVVEYQPVRVANVLIVGQTGTGKSTFLQTLMNPAYTSHFEVESQTKEANLQNLGFKVGKEFFSLTIIDTPGFSDTSNKSDMEVEKLILDFVKKGVTSLNMVLIAIPMGRRIDAHHMDTIQGVCGFLGQEMRNVTYILGTHSEGRSDDEKREWIAQLKKTNLSSVVKYVKGKFVWNGMMSGEKSLEGGRREQALQEMKRNQQNTLQKAVSGPNVKLSGDEMAKIRNKFSLYESAAKDSLLLKTLLPEMEVLARNLRNKREKLAAFVGNKEADMLCEKYKDIEEAKIKEQIVAWSNCQNKVESYMETGKDLSHAAEQVREQYNRLHEGEKEILRFLNSAAWAEEEEEEYEDSI